MAWLQDATQKKDPIARQCETLVSITKLAFQEGFLPETMIWTTMILLTKGDEVFRGFGLVEVIYKLFT